MNAGLFRNKAPATPDAMQTGIRSGFTATTAMNPHQHATKSPPRKGSRGGTFRPGALHRGSVPSKILLGLWFQPEDQQRHRSRNRDAQGKHRNDNGNDPPNPGPRSPRTIQHSSAEKNQSGARHPQADETVFTLFRQHLSPQCRVATAEHLRDRSQAGWQRTSHNQAFPDAKGHIDDQYEPAPDPVKRDDPWPDRLHNWRRVPHRWNGPRQQVQGASFLRNRRVDRTARQRRRRRLSTINGPGTFRTIIFLPDFSACGTCVHRHSGTSGERRSRGYCAANVSLTFFITAKASAT